MTSSCGQEDRVSLASYNEPCETITHASVTKLSFGHFFVQSIKILKKQPNDNLLTLACVITLVHYSFINFVDLLEYVSFVHTWMYLPSWNYVCMITQFATVQLIHNFKPPRVSYHVYTTRVAPVPVQSLRVNTTTSGELTRDV